MLENKKHDKFGLFMLVLNMIPDSIHDMKRLSVSTMTTLISSLKYNEQMKYIHEESIKINSSSKVPYNRTNDEK